MNRTFRSVFILTRLTVLALVGIAGMGSTAVRADEVKTFLDLSVSPDTVKPGDPLRIKVTLRGQFVSDLGTTNFDFTGARPVPDVDLYVDDRLLLTRSTPDGTATFDFTPPLDLKSGVHAFKARFRGGVFMLDQFSTLDPLPPAENTKSFAFDTQSQTFALMRLLNETAFPGQPINFLAEITGRAYIDGAIVDFDWQGASPDPVFDVFAEETQIGSFAAPNGVLQGQYVTRAGDYSGDFTIRFAFAGGVFSGLPILDRLPGAADGEIFTVLNKADFDGYTRFTGVSIDPPNILPGDLITIEGTLLYAFFADGVEKPLANRAVTLWVNSTKVADTGTDGNGYVKIAVTPDVVAGNSVVRFRFEDPNKRLGPSAGFAILGVRRLPSSIATTDFTGSPGQTVALKGTLTNANTAAPIAGRTLVFKIDGAAAGIATTDATGVGTLNYLVSDTGEAGDKGLTVEFKGDGNYLASLASAKLTVNAVTTGLQVPDTTGVLGQKVALTAVLKRTDSGVGLSGRTVRFKVAGADAGTAETDSTGTATLNFNIPADLGGGDKVVEAAFAGTGPFGPASASGKLTVTRGISLLSADDNGGSYGQVVALTATLTLSGRDEPIAGKTLSYQVEGQDVGTAVTDAMGVAKLNFTIPEDLPSGIRPYTVTFAGDDSLEAAKADAAITVLKGILLIDVTDVSGVVGHPVTLTGLLKRNADRSGVSGKTLTFKVNGSVLGTAVTDANGIGLLTIPLPGTIVGSNPLTVAFAGDNLNYPAEGTGKITVTKAETTLAVNDASGGYTERVVLRASLTTAGDGTAVAGRTVTFKIDGTAAGTAVTDTVGVAQLLYTVPAPETIAPGDHALTVEFAGDAAYGASAKSGKLTVTKARTTVRVRASSGTRGQSATLSAQLVRNGDSTNLAGQTLTFSIDKKPVGTGTTAADGVASFDFMVPADFDPGAHEILVEYQGDTRNLRSAGLGTLTVAQ